MAKKANLAKTAKKAERSRMIEFQTSQCGQIGQKVLKGAIVQSG